MNEHSCIAACTLQVGPRRVRREARGSVSLLQPRPRHRHCNIVPVPSQRQGALLQLTVQPNGHWQIQPSFSLTCILHTSCTTSSTYQIPDIRDCFTMVTQSPAFKTAVEDSRKLTSKPTNDELLEVCLPLREPPTTGGSFSRVQADK